MSKKCLAIAKKAMVWTLAASMLVATPLTASAAGLRDVYSVSDGTNTWDSDGKESESNTGTVTTTDTNTSVLGENDAKIIGIALDKTQINAEKGKKETLKATVILDGAVSDEVREALNNKIKWEVQEADKKILSSTNSVLSITVKAGDRTTATLNPRQGTIIGEDMRVVAKIDGKQKITYTDKETGEKKTKEFAGLAEPYEAVAKVFIKEYSTALSFSGVPNAYVKHTLDMNEYLVRKPARANDSIAWSSSDTKVATVTDAGMVTFKKVTAEGKPVVITAVSEKGVVADYEFTVTAGTGASKVLILNSEDNKPFARNKTDVDMSNEASLTVNTEMYAKVKSLVNGRVKTVEVKDGEPYPNAEGNEVTLEVTDTIKWVSNKPAIVAVETDREGKTADLVAKSVGTAKITATTSSGKKASLTVTVSASITGLKIEQDEDTYYTGQAKQLTVTRWSGEQEIEANNDGLKWSIEKITTASGSKKTNPNASINSKGVLTIKPKLDPTYADVTVKVTGKKSYAKDAAGKKVYPEGTATIHLEQSSIDEIIIKDDAGTVIATLKQSGTRFKANEGISKTDNTTKISVPKSRTYSVEVKGTAGGEESLKWAASGKAAKVTAENGAKVTIKAEASGTSKVTVSGIHADYNADKSVKKASVVKTTFSVSVKQPTTQITMSPATKVLKDTGKDQSVSLSTKQNKNAKEELTWQLFDEDGQAVASSVATITPKSKGAKATVKLLKGKYHAGDVFVAVATSAESGVTAEAKIKVVTASAAVQIRDPEDETKTLSYYKKKSNGQKGSEVKNATVLAVGESLELVSYVNVGGTKSSNPPQWIEANTEAENGKVAADVTYSVNKKGIVQIVNGIAYRVKAGSVTITAKTEDGKSYKLKIDDASKAYLGE